MKRRLFTILSALSMLLCVAVVVLWARSGTAGDLWTCGWGSREYWVRSDWGRIVVGRSDGVVPRWAWDRGGGGYHGALPGRAMWRRDLGVLTIARGHCRDGQEMGPRRA